MREPKCPSCWHMVANHGPKGCRAMRMRSSGNFQAKKVLCGCKLKHAQATKGAKT